MLLIVHASQEAVLARLGSPPGGASVGPTSSSGWTAVWTEYAPFDPTKFSQVIMLAECDAGLSIEFFAPSEHHRCIITVDAVAAVEVQFAADRLCEWFGAEGRESAVSRLLIDSDGRDDLLADDLADVLDLPSLYEPDPTRAVVVHHGDPRPAVLAARIAGPTYVTSLADDWTVLSSVDEPGDYVMHGSATSAASRRRDTVLALWRAEGGGSGFALFRGDDIAARTSWCGWVWVDDRRTDEAAIVAAASKLTDGHHDAVALRSLVRASTWPSDPLIDLVSFLGLPAAVLDVLDSPTHRVATTQRLAAAHPVRAWREVVRRGNHEPSAPCWLLRLWAVGTALAAIVLSA